MLNRKKRSFLRACCKYSYSIVERVKGIEPSSSAWKADALAIVLYPQVLIEGTAKIVLLNTFPKKEYVKICLKVYLAELS